MPRERSSESLIELFPDWPKDTPRELLRELELLDRAVAPSVRAERWADVKVSIVDAVSSLRSRFPRYKAALSAFEAEWLSSIEAGLGDIPAAIDALFRRLVARIPRTPFRASHYLTLVVLLQHEGLDEIACEFGARALRFYGRRDPATAAAISKALHRGTERR